MSFRASSIVALAIAALGLLIGPVLTIYGAWFSGTKVATHQLVLGSPLELQLSPEMNPIRFRMHTTFDSEGRRERGYNTRYRYRSTLTADGDTIWNKRFKVLGPRKVPEPIQMAEFSVDRAGTYILMLRPRSNSRSPTDVIFHLHIIRNFTPSSIAVLMLGFFMIMFGVGWFVVIFLIRSGEFKTKQDGDQISAEQIPYSIESRPMPRGKDINDLLPVRVGSHTRDPIDERLDTDNPTYATYRRTGGGSVFVELGICEDPIGAQRALETAKAETDAEFPDEPQLFVQQRAVWCLKTANQLGAFLAWTRGPYYFSAHAKGGEEDLDEFMNAFPY